MNMLALRATRIVTRQAKQCRTFMALSEEHDQIRDGASLVGPWADMAPLLINLLSKCV